MKEITRNDFNLFQNEILGLIKKIDNKSTDKIAELNGYTQKFQLITEQKFENFKIEISELIKSLETNNVIVKINEKITELNAKIEEVKAVNNTKLSNFERNLSNACFKYDKIFLNNISCPGLIGDGCPYPTMRNFLEYSNNKINDFMKSKDKFGIDFKKYHDWVTSTLDKFREELFKYKEEMDNILRKEIKEYDKRSINKMNAVEDKLSFIRIENGRYNFKLNKKWEELEEKLKLFYNMNDNLIRIYNKARQEVIKTQKEVNNIAQYLNYAKTDGNKVTYDKFNKRININSKIQGVNSENVLPVINSFDEISKPLLTTSKNKNSENNSKAFNIQNNTKNIRLFKKKFTMNLDFQGFGINNANKLKRAEENFNNFINDTKEDKNDKEELEKNTKNEISQRTARKKMRTYRKNNFIIEEKDELSIYGQKKTTSNKKDIIVQEIEEESHIENEKIDRQTSALSIKNIINKNDSNKKLLPFKINSFTFETKYTNSNSNNNDNNIKDSPEKDKEDKQNYKNKINYSEEYNNMKNKFEDLYDNSNKKINDLVKHLNNLINNMNKVIFNPKNSMQLIKENDFFHKGKRKKLYVNNSGTNFSLPLNISNEDKMNKTLKEKDIIKEKASNLKQNFKRNLLINDQYINENIKFDTKMSELRANSNDVIKLYDEKGIRPSDYYLRMLRIQSVNQIENYLIKKFTEPN